MLPEIDPRALFALCVAVLLLSPFVAAGALALIWRIIEGPQDELDPPPAPPPSAYELFDTGGSWQLVDRGVVRVASGEHRRVWARVYARQP